jgi:integrase
MLLKELAKKYRLRNLGSASQSSLKTWTIAFRMFDRFLGRPATVDDLDDDVFCAFIAWRRQSVASATVNRDLVSLLACWRWGHKIGKVPRWPQVNLQKVPTRTPMAWTQEEFNALLSAAKQSCGFIGCVQASDWWTALLLTLFDTGERINAVISLNWSNVQLDTGWVRFPAETRKGQREDSLVRIHQDTCQAVRKLRGKCRDRVFDWPYCRTYIWKRYGDLLTQAGLPATAAASSTASGRRRRVTSRLLAGTRPTLCGIPAGRPRSPTWTPASCSRRRRRISYGGRSSSARTWQMLPWRSEIENAPGKTNCRGRCC